MMIKMSPIEFCHGHLIAVCQRPLRQYMGRPYLARIDGVVLRDRTGRMRTFASGYGAAHAARKAVNDRVCAGLWSSMEKVTL